MTTHVFMVHYFFFPDVFRKADSTVKEERKKEEGKKGKKQISHVQESRCAPEYFRNPEYFRIFS